MSESFKPVEVRLAPDGNLLARPYDWLNKLSRGKAMAFAFAMGVFSNLAFAPSYFWPAMMVGLVSMVWMLDGATRQPNPRSSAFWRVFFYAFGLFGIGFHWISFAFLVDASTHIAYIWMVLALPLGLAVIWGFVMRVGMNFWSPGPTRVLLFALTLFLAEWIRGHLFGGFPWNIPAMAWRPGGAVSQIASVLGVWGLSLITLVFLCAPAAIVDGRKNVVSRAGGLGRAAPMIAAAVVMGMTWGWGTNRLMDAGEISATGPEVRLVDAGVPQGEKFKPEVGPLLTRRYLQLTGVDNGTSPSIVIWPEGALPYPIFRYPSVLDAIQENLGGRRLILGTSFESKENRKSMWYNSLAVLSSESLVAEAIYYKHRLVPFGEMVPLRGLFSAIGFGPIQQIAKAGFYAGPPPSTVSVEGVPDFQPLICYEALFPGLLPRREKEKSDANDNELSEIERPDWIVNISIDAWFGTLWAPFQHMEHARYRSIEEGLPMVRVASRGMSGVIDSYGRITALAHAPDATQYAKDPKGWKAKVLDARLPRPLEPTIFSQFRSVFALFLFVTLIFTWLMLPRN